MLDRIVGFLADYLVNYSLPRTRLIIALFVLAIALPFLLLLPVALLKG